MSKRLLIDNDLIGSRKLLYHLLFEANPLPVWLYDSTSLQIVDVNEVAISHYGYSREEFLCLSMGDIEAPAPAETKVEEDSQPAAHGQCSQQNRHRKKDGTVIDVEVFRTDVAGSTPPLQFVMANDVTQWLQKARLAEQARKELEEREAKFSLGLSIGQLGLWEQDLGTGVLWWSAETYRIFGLDCAETCPSERTFLESLHPEDRDLVSSGLRTTGSNLKNFDYEFRIVRPDGSIRWIHGRAQPVLDNSAKPLRLIGTLHDITEKRSLADQLRQAQKMEAVGTLAGGVAHDFNNLLGVISGYCDLLLKKMPDTDPHQRSILQIGKAADRAASLTRQLLAFSRRQMIQPEILDLNKVVIGLQIMLERLIGEDIDLRVVSRAKLWNVSVDAGQMEQVLMNLVVNARDAMPNGGQITIETVNFHWHGGCIEHVDVPPGAYVMLAVSDTGCGMTQEVKSRVFEPFFTTKGPGMGTGLGLSTVYGIVKQNNGYIWVYSEVGVGTTFKIYLPAIKEVQPYQSQPASNTVHQQSETVLVVEDQEMFREIMCEVLMQNGYRVLVAQDGDEALQVCRDHPDSIDLVLSDVVMPKMSGPQLAEKLAKSYPAIKMLFMSGYTEDVILRHGMLSHSEQLLQKPFTPENLLQRMQRVLAG